MRPNNLNDPSKMQREIIKAQRILAVSALVGHTSVNEGALRIASEEGLIVEGSSKVTGRQDISGTQNVSGTHNVSGTQTVSGTSNLNGPTNVRGNLAVTG